MNWRTSILPAALSLSIILLVNPTHALNEPTHDIINQQATRQSNLDRFLRDQLAFEQGIEQSLNGRLVIDWLGEGGVREDDEARFLNHFHNPLRPWGSAGLFGTNPSSIRWMQDDNSGWSWQNARNYYWTALTATTKADREKAFADTFRALGQVMHLVVDASVPEHVRNDPHPAEGACRMIGIRCFGNYEYWVSDQHGRQGSTGEASFISSFLASPIGFDPSILQQPTNDSAVPVMVARLIDTDTYTGTGSGPNVTLSPAIGIGEIANANFFSEDTIDGSYPFPNVNALVLSQLSQPDTGKVFRYYKKGVNDGIPNDVAAAECVFDQAARDQGAYNGPTYYCADELVWAATAKEMLPRAVGYARGVLDYFFRGKIDSTPWPGLYVLVPWSQKPTSIRVENVAVKVDGTNEQGGQGSMRLVLLYRYRHVGTPAGAPEVVISQPVAISASSSPQTVVFPFDALPFPLAEPEISGSNIYGYSGILVFKGGLGQESDAVIAAGYCLDPSDGSRYDRVYQFEHSVSGLWFDNEAAAYIDYFGC
jgi:hypothetical protein